MARPDLPTGTVTFLFTDIEGSTRLLHDLGVVAYAAALQEHRTLLRGVFAAADGVEVDTQGDAFFVAFPTAPGAAEAAAAAHQVLASRPVKVRIGLHTGTPALTGEGYVGEDVNRGARIAALAHGGQTLVSGATKALLTGGEVRDLGLHRLKNFEGATHVFQLGPGAFAPLRSPGSVDLPTPGTPFLGRQHELLDAISIALERDPHVLTVTGPGGIGKTRFAIELARLLADETDGGTVFLPLAAVRDSGQIISAVAGQLGAASADLAAIGARVGDRPTRLVVDNLEQLLPDAAVLLASLTAAVPALRLLVTSREALRIQGEEEFDLAPMLESDSVELFLARARAARPGLERTPAVDELCARLDRLPLAVELAAARTKLLSPEALLERLGERLDLLRGTRDADPRHATLEATIAWSYDLLDEDEQRVFASLAVFRGGCTAELADEVCDADINAIGSLLDKSLIRRRADGDGADRFWMLETIREFAASRLEESGTGDDVRARLARRMLEVARSAHLSEETGLGLEVHWITTDPGAGSRLLGDLLARAEAPPAELRARALRVHGGTTFLSGEREAAVGLFNESLAEYERLGDEQGVAHLLQRLASSAAQAGETERARELLDRAVELGRRSGLVMMDTLAAGTRAIIEAQEGNLESARDEFLLAATLAGDIGFSWWQSMNLANAIEIGVRLGQGPELEPAALDLLRLATETGGRIAMICGVAGLAQVELERGELERAGRLWGAVADDVERDPIDHSQPDFPAYSGPLREVVDARFVLAMEGGRELGLSEIAAEILARAQTLP